MTVKRRARLWAAAILALAGLSANASYTPSSGYAVAASPNEGTLRAELLAVLPGAEKQARDSFDRFFRAALLTTRTGPDSAVRVRHEGQDIWLFGVRRIESGFSGHPAGETTTITFSRNDIMDWSHEGRDGRLHGNFGARAMMEVLPDYRAAMIATTLSLEPLPSGW